MAARAQSYPMLRACKPAGPFCRKPARAIFQPPSRPPVLSFFCSTPVLQGPHQLGAHSHPLSCSLTRVPREDDPTWARRWPGMKSSRLSPAGRLQGGACMLGSRSEDSGCASSSAGPLWGNRQEGKAWLGLGCLYPQGGGGGTAVGEGQGQLSGSSRTQETGHCGHPPAGCQCRLPEVQWAAC